MLLAIDIGNTNIVAGVFRDGELVAQARTDVHSCRDRPAIIWFLGELIGEAGAKEVPVAAIMASVVPVIDEPMVQALTELTGAPPLVIGDPSTRLGLSIQVDRPEEVGADRLVNAVAAHELVGGPVLVLDLGTATTFDIVGADGSYLGGVIAPGIQLSLKALGEAAAKLPEIPFAQPVTGEVTGKNTVDAMHSGVFWGYVGLVEGIVARLNAEHGVTFKVIATGGLAPLIASETAAITAIDGDLTLKGLDIIYQRNFEKEPS